jgi:hypothetical protein
MYTEYMMKKTVKTKARSTTQVSPVRARRTVTRSPLSKIARSTKRYGKQTLRDLLLSKTFNSGFKVLIGVLISGTALYGAYAFIGNTFANDIVVSKSEILARAAKHADLPSGNPDAVVRVQDPETLKKQNDFYANVKEGDYIIMYPNVAIIYDLRNDSVVALKRTDR